MENDTFHTRKYLLGFNSQDTDHYPLIKKIEL